MIPVQYRFKDILRRFKAEEQQIENCWNEINTAYNLPERHYHNLKHIEQMLVLLDEVKPYCSDFVSLQLVVFYHDIVYDAQRNDNEVQSAELARKRLQALNYENVDEVVTLILATKKHEQADNEDTNFLLDIDLNILGAEWPDYEQYAEQIRKEYQIYPDEVYNPGRVQVLKHFLNASRIFKTDYFYQKYEQQARKNIAQEIIQLS